MSFLALTSTPASNLRAGRDTALLHRMGCRACPLANLAGNLHPQMEPTGSNKPLVYMLGEAPGSEEDKQGRQFVGESGALLRPLIPERYRKLVRWNNVVRTRPQNNRTPTHVEIECFPAETLVQSIGQLRGGYRRWYSGPMVTIHTKKGRVLTGTPKHPVFTERGEISLGKVNVGENLFCAVGGQSRIHKDGFVSKERWAPNVENKPAPIVEVVCSLLKGGKLKRVSSSPLDFNGDG